MKKVLKITGMTCKNCEMKVYNALTNLSGVNRVKVKLKQQKVILNLTENIADDILIETIANLGYTAEVI